MLKSLFLERKAAAKGCSERLHNININKTEWKYVTVFFKFFFSVLMVYNSFFANFDLGNID